MKGRPHPAAPAGQTGLHPSLALNGSGAPRIGYGDLDLRALRYAERGGPGMAPRDDRPAREEPGVRGVVLVPVWRHPVRIVFHVSDTSRCCFVARTELFGCH